MDEKWCMAQGPPAFCAVGPSGDKKTDIKGPCYYACKRPINQDVPMCDCGTADPADGLPDWCMEKKCAGMRTSPACKVKSIQ